MAAQINRKQKVPFRCVYFQVSTLTDMERLQSKFSSLELDISPQSGLGRRRWFSCSIMLLEAYCKQVNSKEFRSELERDLGRKLTDNQVYRAVLSIRKLRKYIEDLLDGRFTPHDTHGINHTKHNLEYGYQVMDLIERNRRRASSK